MTDHNTHHVFRLTKRHLHWLERASTYARTGDYAGLITPEQKRDRLACITLHKIGYLEREGERGQCCAYRITEAGRARYRQWRQECDDD